MNDPDVIVRIGKHTNGLPEHPVIGKRFGPHRVDLEPRRLHAARLCGGCLVEHSLADSKRSKDHDKTGTDEEIPCVFPIAHDRLPWGAKRVSRDAAERKVPWRPA